MAETNDTSVEKRIATIDLMVRQLLRDHNTVIQAVEQLQRNAKLLEEYKLMLPGLVVRPLAIMSGKSAFQRFMGRLMTILLARDIEPTELQGVLAAVLWGIWFIIGGGQLSPVSLAYEYIFELAPPLIWGLAFIALGGFQLYALITDRWRLRRIGAMLAVFLWLTIAVLLALVDWRFISAATSFGFALGAAWGYLRLRLDSRNAADRGPSKQ
jgi:FtsH-binding integral membrane protein